jgi:hypothetical protein
MNLPNYFLADLPPEATISAAMVGEACQTLKRNREHYLAHRSTRSLVQTLSTVAANWLEPEYPFRKLALASSDKSGFTSPTLAAGLDAFFKELTPSNFETLLEQEFGHAQRADAWSSSNAEQKSRRAAMVQAPSLIAHITAGNLPNPALLSMVFGVLLRSAQFVKCASGTSLLPRLFAHSLYEAEPKLGACLEVAEWRGGAVEVENALFIEADCVTATGSDETQSAIRARVPPGTRLVGYGHRVSFAFIADGVLSGIHTRKTVEQAGSDVVSWNQLGCLSPHVIYVQSGGTVSPELFAQLLAEELERQEQSLPRGALPAELAATIASRRAFYEVRAAHSPDTRLWSSRNSTAWTVVYEADSRFQLSCLHRFIYVKAVASLTEVLQGADGIRHQTSTVGLGAPEERIEELATELARWGATRVCPLGRMQQPPLAWRHDGRPVLGDLVTWTDWEKP